MNYLAMILGAVIMYGIMEFFKKRKIVKKDDNEWTN